MLKTRLPSAFRFFSRTGALRQLEWGGIGHRALWAGRADVNEEELFVHTGELVDDGGTGRINENGHHLNLAPWENLLQKQVEPVNLVLVDRHNQGPRPQRRELMIAAQRNGWTIVKEFRDVGISGVKGRDKRPGLDQLLQGIARREFDRVAVWSTDRLGRSMKDLVGVLEELKAKNVDLYDHHHGLDTATPMGRSLFLLSDIFAEIERGMIVDRIHAGPRRARAEGKKLGRPRIRQDVEDRIREQLALGHSVRTVANLVGVASSTVQRVRHRFTPWRARGAARAQEYFSSR